MKTKLTTYLLAFFAVLLGAGTARAVDVYAFDGLTPSQSITYGDALVVLTGTVTDNAVPVTSGSVTVKINGNTQGPVSVNGSGKFSINYTTATIPAAPGSPYTIFYYYNGTSATDNSTALTVNQATPTLTVINSPQIYYGGAWAATINTTGLGGGYLAGTINNVTYNGSGTQPNVVGIYAVKADFAPSDSNYKSVTAASAGNFEIIKATPTATLNNPNTAVYDGTPKTASVTFSPSGGSGTVIYYNGSSTAPSAAGAYPITVDYTPPDPANYNSLTNTPTSPSIFNIAQAEPTVTLIVNNSPKTYNGSPQAASVVTSPGDTAGTVSHVQYDGSDTVPTSANNGVAYNITADFTPSNTNYKSKTGLSAGAFLIQKANPTLSFAVGAPISVPYSYNPVTFAGIQQNANVVTNSTSVPPNGTWTVKHYVGGFPGGTLTTPINVATYTCTAIYTPLPADQVNYNTSPETLASGTYQITQVLATPRLTISSTTPITYDGASHTPTVANLTGPGIQGTVSGVLVGGLAGQSAVGVYAVTANFIPTGTPDSINFAPTNNYPLNVAPTQLTIQKATPVFSALTPSQSITYGTTTLSLSGTVSAPGPIYPSPGELVHINIGAVNQNVAVGALGQFSTTTLDPSSLPVGPHTITYSYGGDDNLFAAADDTSTQLTVGTASVTITALDKLNKIYGSTYPVGAGVGPAYFTVIGMQNGQSISSVTFNSPGSPATASVTGNPYTITPSTPVGTGGSPAYDANNYTFHFVDGTLTIAPYPGLTITVVNTNKTYGTLWSSPALLASGVYTVAGLQAGDAVDQIGISSTGLPANAPANVVPYALDYIPGSAAGVNFTVANYNPIAFVNGTLTVNKLPAILRGSRGYDATTTAASSILTVFNKVPGDDVIVASGSGTLNPPAPNLGNGITFSSFGSLALGGTTAVNYTLADPTSSVDIAKANTTTTLASSATPACPNIAFSLTATVSGGNPAGGTVEIWQAPATLLATLTLPGSGPFTVTLPGLSYPAGNYQFFAKYLGDAYNNASTSSPNLDQISDGTAPTVFASGVPFTGCYSSVNNAEAAAIRSTSATDNGTPGSGLKWTVQSVRSGCTATTTVSASDSCGNTTQYNTLYSSTIYDNYPVITQGTMPSKCYAGPADAITAALAATTATDSCGGLLTRAASVPNPSCNATVFVSATDCAGQVTTVSFTGIKILVNKPTIFQRTSPVILSCYKSWPEAQTAVLNATASTDSCGNDLTYPAYLAVTTVGDNCSGTASITVTATDCAGQTKSKSYTGIKVYPSAPIWHPSNPSIASCYPSMAAAVAAAKLAVSFTDSCNALRGIQVTTSQDNCKAYVTVSTSDCAGNTAAVTFSPFMDSTAPVATAGTIEACYLSLSDASTAAIAATTAIDNCSTSFSITATTTFVDNCNYRLSVTVADVCGNKSTVNYPNVRIDTTGPAVGGPTDLLTKCYKTAAEAQTDAIAVTTSTDTCGGTTLKWAETIGGTPNDCAATVTVHVIDACGFTADKTYRTRIDNTPPLAGARPAMVAVCYATVQAALDDAKAATTGSDNCSALGELTKVATTQTDNLCAAVIAVTVYDACGNASLPVTYNTRIDTTAPIVTKGAGIDNTCYKTLLAVTNAVLAATTATDNCPGLVQLYVTTTQIDCVVAAEVRAYDTCGNNSAVVYTVSVDSTSPTVTLNTALMKTCYPSTDAFKADARANTTVSDFCTPQAQVAGTIQVNVGQVVNCQATVTVTANDCAGNSTTTAAYQAMVDTGSPVVSTQALAQCYTSITAAEAAAIAATSAYDNCSGISKTVSSSMNGCTNTITVRVSNCAGTITPVTFPPVKILSSPPLISMKNLQSCYAGGAAALADAIAQTTAADSCGQSLTVGAATTIDNCHAVIKVTATDCAGQVITGFYPEVKILIAKPTITKGSMACGYQTWALFLSDVQTKTTAKNSCTDVLSFGTSTSTTNPGSPDCGARITVTTTDCANQVTTATYDSKILPTAPSIVPKAFPLGCYTSWTQATNDVFKSTSFIDTCSAMVTPVVSTTGDNCVATVTLTATDCAGNVSTKAVAVKVFPSNPTIASLPPGIAACYPTWVQAQAAALAVTSATDSCLKQIPLTLADETTSGSDCSAVIKVVATDCAGRKSPTMTYNTRIDNTKPLGFKTGTIAGCYQTIAAAQAAAIAATSATDNCTGNLTPNALIIGNDPCNVTVAVTWTDQCGNVSDPADPSHYTSFPGIKIDNVAPSLGTVAAGQNGDVLNCAKNVTQGVATLTVVATDNCALVAAPVVGLTNGATGQTATFAGGTGTSVDPYRYTWPVTAAMPNGTWTGTVTATDFCGSTQKVGFTLCVNKSQITGSVQLQGFIGTGTVPPSTRAVVFVATTTSGDNGTVLKTWTLPLTFTVGTPSAGGTASYTLTDVPPGTLGLSAKTDWSLRRKLPVTLPPNGQFTANFIGTDPTTGKQLRGGDISGLSGSPDNQVQFFDYLLLISSYPPATFNPAADINGSGGISGGDYNALSANWFQTGDPQ